MAGAPTCITAAAPCRRKECGRSSIEEFPSRRDAVRRATFDRFASGTVGGIAAPADDLTFEATSL